MNQTRQKRQEIRRKIEEEFLILFPEFKDGTYLRGSAVAPHEGLGRFLRERVNYSIQLEETATFSRKQTVYVKVNPDGTFQLDKEKLTEKANLLKAIVARELEGRKKAEAARTLVPSNLPRGAYVEARSDGTFNVTFKEHYVTAERMQEIVKALQYLSKNESEASNP